MVTRKSCVNIFFTIIAMSPKIRNYHPIHD